jgi:hypothetical protein
MVISVDEEKALDNSISFHDNRPEEIRYIRIIPQHNKGYI